MTEHLLYYSRFILIVDIDFCLCFWFYPVGTYIKWRLLYHIYGILIFATDLATLPNIYIDCRRLEINKCSDYQCKMAATAITDNDSVNYFLFFVFGFVVSLALVSLSIAVHIAMEKMYPDNPQKEESPVIRFTHIEWTSVYINHRLSNVSWKMTIPSIICTWKLLNF